MAAFTDEQFLNPSVALVANVSPASITNGATTVAGSGVSTAAGMAAYVAALVDAADDLVDPVWIMRATTYTRMATTLQMPGIKIQNGELAGIPLLCSKSVPAPPRGLAFHATAAGAAGSDVVLLAAIAKWRTRGAA